MCCTMMRVNRRIGAKTAYVAAVTGISAQRIVHLPHCEIIILRSFSGRCSSIFVIGGQETSIDSISQCTPYIQEGEAAGSIVDPLSVVAICPVIKVTFYVFFILSFTCELCQQGITSV